MMRSALHARRWARQCPPTGLSEDPINDLVRPLRLWCKDDLASFGNRYLFLLSLLERNQN